MIHPYLENLSARFLEHRNIENALSMKKYMRDKFEFFGIKTPVRKEIQKKYFLDYGLPLKSELGKIVLNLWELDKREFQYFAIALLEKFKNKQEKDDILTYEKLIASKSWWDTVDGLAGWIVGNYFRYFQQNIQHFTGKWYDSGNIWLQRTILLFQIKYKNETNESLLYDYIRKLSASKEFFIQKAIGWILREYAKTNPESVIEFVEHHQLSSLSRKEALKHIKPKF